MNTKIDTARFYFEYKGHPIEDVATFLDITTTHRPGAPIVYLAGDSSLDNKYWLPAGHGAPDCVPAIYQLALHPARPKCDVAFWLNRRLGARATALNLAVEASLLRERHGSSALLLAHDAFIRDHMTADDVLVVSVGANDIALRPTARTVLHMLWLAWLTPLSSIRSGRACALRYFVRMFRAQTEAYVEKLVAARRPRAVVVCMIYYPLEARAGLPPSWADRALAALGYDSRPERLQAGIRQLYEQATRKIQIEGVQVRTCALFEAMDGKNVEDYEERVEPSVEGGRKMAELLGPLIEQVLQNT
ncbi:hypothetical protein CCM_07810 [Cordyceps militaris CM01]|uniref:Esterase n=1 Tax=Cordyceps militaris (strain CM01) TaxID=983644 RepID=G3JNU8_CORMM|nr:uncharacterized protein CCM_07810 [Cordyceps militaris CM01]EGX89558.1 hypothetical protein CCM_07810 [Cordyceps militaris CM01]